MQVESELVEQNTHRNETTMNNWIEVSGKSRQGWGVLIQLTQRAGVESGWLEVVAGDFR